MVCLTLSCKNAPSSPAKFQRSPASPFAKTPTQSPSRSVGSAKWRTPKHLAETVRNALPTTTVLAPGDKGFEAERADCWNKDIVDKVGQPAAIIQPVTTKEVSDVVKFAARRGERLVIAGGRHGHDCFASGALVLDMSKLKEVVVDKQAMTVTVSGGNKLGEMDTACRPHGLACVTGTNPDTGVCGLSLCGGGGYLNRQYGLAVDNFVSAEVVLATGEIVAPTATNEHADLFWALTGGGSNFGVVTKLTMKAHPIDRVYGGLVLNVALHQSTSRTIVANWRDWILAAPRSVASAAVLPCGAPLVPTINAELDQALIPQEGARAGLKHSPGLKAAFGKRGAFGASASIKMLKPMSYHSDLQPALLAMQASGHYYDASVIVPELSSDVIATLVEHTRVRHPNKHAAVIIFPLCGAIADRAPTDTAFFGGGRKAEAFWIIIEGKFEPGKKEDGEARRKVVAWVKALRDALSAFGVHETAHTLDGNMEAAMAGNEAIYGPNLARLRRVKGKYDPQNFFKCNRNIEPDHA